MTPDLDDNTGIVTEFFNGKGESLGFSISDIAKHRAIDRHSESLTIRISGRGEMNKKSFRINRLEVEGYLRGQR